MTEPVPPVVAAALVTHRRPAVLLDTLAAVIGQTRQAEHVIVVDNASGDRTPDLVAERFPDVQVVQAGTNLGFGGGLNRAIAHLDGAVDLLWILDDDTRPHPHALATLLGVAASQPEETVVATRSSPLRMGTPAGHQRELPLLADEPGVRRAEWCLVDGALVPLGLFDEVGTFREDLFMMCEDLDLTTRAGRSGWGMVVLDEPLVEAQHLGSVPDGDHSSTAWRGYYQARNLLRIALERRSGEMVLGWLRREAAVWLVTAVRRRDAPTRLGFRLRGAVDACRGRMGRRVEPGTLSARR